MSYFATWFMATSSDSSDTFWFIGCEICKHNTKRKNDYGNRKFRNFFGTCAVVCLQIWNLVIGHLPSFVEPKHLLWSLLFLRQYHTEAQNAALVATSEKTFREYVHLIVPSIAFEIHIVNLKL